MTKSLSRGEHETFFYYTKIAPYKIWKLIRKAAQIISPVFSFTSHYFGNECHKSFTPKRLKDSTFALASHRHVLHVDTEWKKRRQRAKQQRRKKERQKSNQGNSKFNASERGMRKSWKTRWKDGEKFVVVLPSLLMTSEDKHHPHELCEER